MASALRHLSPTSRTVILVATLLTLVPSLLRLRLEASVHGDASLRDEDVAYLPGSSTLAAISLGYRSALADVVYVQALVYFGEQVGKAGRVANLRRYADAVLDLDPHFYDAYRWAGVVTMYNTGAITKAKVETSVRYLRRAVREFPDDADLAYMLGFNLYFELPQLESDPERAEAARREGLLELEHAAARGGGPPFLPLAVASLLAGRGDRQLAFAHLASVYDRVTDAATREQIRLRLGVLRGEAEAEAFAQAVAESQGRWQAEFPYVPFTFYLLLGPRMESGRGVRAAEPEPEPAPAPTAAAPPSGSGESRSSAPARARP